MQSVGPEGLSPLLSFESCLCISCIFSMGPTHIFALATLPQPLFLQPLSVVLG